MGSFILWKKKTFFILKNKIKTQTNMQRKRRGILVLGLWGKYLEINCNRWKQTSVDQWGLTLYTLPPSGVRIWKWMRLNHQILLFQIPSQIGSPFCLSYGPAWWPIMSGNLDCKLQLHRDLTLWTSFSKHLSIAGSVMVSFRMLQFFLISKFHLKSADINYLPN